AAGGKRGDGALESSRNQIVGADENTEHYHALQQGGCGEPSRKTSYAHERQREVETDRHEHQAEYGTLQSQATARDRVDEFEPLDDPDQTGTQNARYSAGKDERTRQQA